MSRRVVRAAFAALALVFPLAASAQACVWSAGKDALTQWREDAAPVSVPLNPSDARALAMNGLDCGLWMLGKAQLLRYDAAGAVEQQIALQSIDKRVGLFAHLAVDPYDASVWLAGNQLLAHVSSTGTVLAQPTFKGVVRAAAVALDQSIWLLTDRQIARFSAVGDPLPPFALPQAVPSDQNRMAVDSIRRVAWVSTNRELLQVKLEGGGAAPTRIRAVEAASGIALDPLNGHLWLAEAGHLHAYDASGALVRSVNLAGMGLGKAENIAFDPVGKSLWLWTKQGLARLSAEGTFQAFTSATYGSGLLATPGFSVQPRIDLVEPPQDAITNNAHRVISIGYGAQCNGQPCAIAPSYLASYSLTAVLNEQLVGPQFVFDSSTSQASHTPTTRLPEGLNTVQAQAKDINDRLSNAISAQFTVDTSPPVVTITNPADGAVTNQPAQNVSGSVNEPASVLVNNQVASVSAAGTFTASVTLQEGGNTVNVVAVDRASNSGSAQVGVTLDTQPPAAPLGTAITVSDSSGGLVTVIGTAGAVEGGATVRVTNGKTGVVVSVIAAANGAFSAQIAAAGGEKLSFTATDTAGNQSAVLTVDVPGSGGLPPDPATVATPIDPTVPTQIGSSTAFLYSGANPIQTGVVPGTIEVRRAAVLRGKVMTRDEQALAGVTVTILNQPLLGQTLSRADGMFDMAANGGAPLTVNYAKPGYLPVQRTVDVPWQAYVVVPDVVMIALDPQGATINLGAAPDIQIARSSVVSDSDGSRQATLLFAPGTTATMRLSDGTSQPLGQATVRATEYTVGPSGPSAMPGVLPPTSGYTYAVEFSVDEAIAAGAKEVRFNQPVISYVDNFLDFPVGGIVPAGYYDRDKAAWTPAPNGRVIKVLTIQNGMAELDVDGSGLAANAPVLEQLGIADAERVKLAKLYQPGQSLWRVAIDHFTPWDYNWPYGPTDGAESPDAGVPEGSENEDDPDCQTGSIIECQNLALGETIPILGTPHALTYTSTRSRGYDSHTLSIPLSGVQLPPGVKRINVVVTIAGRRFSHSSPANPNQVFEFVWDGLDAYGRRANSVLEAIVRVGYVYGAVYREPAEFLRSFAGYGREVLITRDGARAEITLWTEHKNMLGRWSPLGLGMGGWTLNNHHTYDPVGNVLHMGDGKTRSARNLQNAIATRAGGGFLPASQIGDGGPATAARLSSPEAVGLDAVGNLFIADAGNRRVRKVSPDGTITTHYGGGWQGCFDGAFFNVSDLAVDSSGNVFVADQNCRAIFKITPMGQRTRYASALQWPTAVAVDRAGNVYFAENGRIGKIDPAGIITTVVNESAKKLAVDAQGNLYFSQGFGEGVVKKVRPNGVIVTVAGGGQSTADGVPARLARLISPAGVAVDAQGNLFISDFYGHTVWRVSPDGIITTAAGAPNATSTGDGGPALAASVRNPRGLAVDTQGVLYIASYAHLVRQVLPVLPSFTDRDVVLASNDGQHLYHFDSRGRHLRTLSSTTGVERYRFGYDARGLLTAVVDGDGNIVRLEYNNEGQLTAIVSPDAQRTAIGLQANGYLGSVQNSAGETVQLAHNGLGLLTAFTNARGLSTTFAYDGRGRLVKDENAAEGSWTLDRSGSSFNYEVRLNSALGRQHRYRVEKTAAGLKRRTHIKPDGTADFSVRRDDGLVENVAADGTVSRVVEGGNPRFGMQAPMVKSLTAVNPSGLTYAETTKRSVALANAFDPTSLTHETQIFTVNGKVHTSVFDVALRQHASTTPMNRLSVVRTDAQERPVFSRVTGIEPVVYSYDNRGRLTGMTQGSGTESRNIVLSYNPQGWLASSTDVLGRSIAYDYDLAGRVTRKTFSDGRVIQFSYDANGNITSVTPPGRPSHGFSYTPVDLEEQYSPPGVASIANPVTKYAYNLDKQLTTVTRPDGQLVQLGYDAGGRLSTTTVPHGVVSYAYTPVKGTLAGISAPGAVDLAYTYDGGLLLDEMWTGPVAGTVARAYNNDFNVTTLTVAGTSFNFSYDNDMLLTSAGALTIGRDADNGFISTTQLGNVATNQSYNAFGEAKNFSATFSGATLFAQTHSYDKLGRIVQKAEQVQGHADEYSYGYDAAGRLETVSKNGAVITTYQYDANGNRTSDGVNQASYDAQDRLVQYGAANYTYTDNGELKTQTVGGQQTQFDYDVAGSLRKATLPDGTVIDYLIDGHNRRIGKKVNGALTQGLLYQDQLNPAAEVDGDNNVKTRFIYGTKSNVPDYMEKGGKTYRVVSDHLGSVRMVVDASTGEVVQRMEYDAFGFVMQDSNPGFQPFGFAGGILDQDTKLTRFGARDYDALTGRWMAKDPILFEGGDTNLFTYVGGNPLSFVDPDGLVRKLGNPVDLMPLEGGGGAGFGGPTASGRSPFGPKSSASQCPPGVKNTLDRIKAGEGYPHRNDGSVFQNKEKQLPMKPDGYYREWVHPTPGVQGPGAQRVVTGQGGEAYYTPDHYRTFIPLP